MHPEEQPASSHQLQCLEAGVPVLAHDEVVVHGDAERARDLDDRLRHLDVGARRGGIAGRMVCTGRPVCLRSYVAFLFRLWASR